MHTGAVSASTRQTVVGHRKRCFFQFCNFQAKVCCLLLCLLTGYFLCATRLFFVCVHSMAWELVEFFQCFIHLILGLQAYCSHIGMSPTIRGWFASFVPRLFSLLLSLKLLRYNFMHNVKRCWAHWTCLPPSSFQQCMPQVFLHCLGLQCFCIISLLVTLKSEMSFCIWEENNIAFFLRPVTMVH